MKLGIIVDTSNSVHQKNRDCVLATLEKVSELLQDKGLATTVSLWTFNKAVNQVSAEMSMTEAVKRIKELEYDSCTCMNDIAEIIAMESPSVGAFVLITDGMHALAHILSGRGANTRQAWTR